MQALSTATSQNPRVEGLVRRTKRGVRALAVISLLSAAASSPTLGYVKQGTFQDASIRMMGDTVCVSMADEGKKKPSPPVTIRGVALGEHTPSGAHYLWRAYFVPAGLEQPSATPGQCIPYERISPFPELHAGKAYEITIVGDSEGSARFYTTYFCMIENAGALDIHAVQFDRKRKVLAWDACPGVAAP